MPRAIEMMRKREEEIRNTILHLSDATEEFTDPVSIMIGGYALRAFIKLSRFTRDCDFVLRKKNGWNIDEVKRMLPGSYSIEEEEKREGYGFMRCIKFVKHDRARVKVSMDFMEGEIRGRKPEEIILIDEGMARKGKLVSTPIAEKPVRIAVPDYVDYFIMKIVSSRASDIRDVASLVHEKGIPSGLEKRVKEIVPHPEIFRVKLKDRIIPEIRKSTFLDSWKGIFATTSYSEQDKENVLKQLRTIMRS